MPVCQIPKHPDTTLSILEAVPIGKALEYNCQNLVGDTLEALVDKGRLTAQRRTDTLDEMVDLLLQGTDDSRCREIWWWSLVFLFHFCCGSRLHGLLVELFGLDLVRNAPSIYTKKSYMNHKSVTT